MAKLSITTDHVISSNTTFDLPEGKTWDDVESWYVKWGTLFLTFKDGSDKEIQTNELTFDSVDFKRPTHATIRPCDEDGDPDWSIEPLAEQ